MSQPQPHNPDAVLRDNALVVRLPAKFFSQRPTASTSSVDDGSFVVVNRPYICILPAGAHDISKLLDITAFTSNPPKIEMTSWMNHLSIVGDASRVSACTTYYTIHGHPPTQLMMSTANVSFQEETAEIERLRNTYPEFEYLKEQLRNRKRQHVCALFPDDLILAIEQDLFLLYMRTLCLELKRISDDPSDIIQLLKRCEQFRISEKKMTSIDFLAAAQDDRAPLLKAGLRKVIEDFVQDSCRGAIISLDATRPQKLLRTHFNSFAEYSFV